MLRILVILVLCIGANLALNAVFRDCSGGNSKANVTFVDIEPCGTANRCDLKRGTSPVVTIKFTPLVDDITEVTAKVTGILPGNIKAPFPLENPNGCHDSGLECPLERGKYYSYKQKIEVKSSYPEWRVFVQWQLLDQTGANISCIVVQTKIVS